MALLDIIERLYDASGEAGACSDRDCGCKSAVSDLRMELEDTRIEAREHMENEARMATMKAEWAAISR